MAKEVTVTKEEFGSLIAEYEGFRDTLFDEIAKLRGEIENLREDLKDLKRTVEAERDRSDRTQLRLMGRA